MEIVNNLYQGNAQATSDPFATAIANAIQNASQNNAAPLPGYADSVGTRPPSADTPKASSLSEPPLTFQQINTILARRNFSPTDTDTQRVLDSIISKPSLYAWLTGSQPDSLGAVGRSNLAYLINSYTEFYGDQIPTAASRTAMNGLNRALDSISTSLWSGLPGLGASPTDAERVTNITAFMSQIAAADNSRAGPNSLASRQRAVGIFAQSVAREAVIVEGYDNLPEVGKPSLETIANSRLVLLSNRLSTPIGVSPSFRAAGFAGAIPILMANVREAANKTATIDNILRPLTQTQNQQIAAAISTNEFLDAFSFKPTATTIDKVPGAYELFVSNVSQSTLKDNKAQFFESMMLNLDKVNDSRRNQALGAITDVIMQNPNEIMFSLYKEDNIDSTNVGNPSGRAMSTYLKYMLEGEKFSDLKAIASLMTIPPGYTIPLNNDAVFNDDAVLNPDGTIKTPATLKTPATVNTAQLNSDQLATFNQTNIFSGRTEYPSVTARAYFLGSFGRALDKLKAEGTNTDNLSKSFANSAIDVTKTVIGVFVKGKLEKLSNDLIAVGAKAVTPALFGNPSNANELLAGLNSVLTPRDPNNTDRPLPVTYVITDTTTDPPAQFAPLSFMATEAARLRAATWIA